MCGEEFCILEITGTRHATCVAFDAHESRLLNVDVGSIIDIGQRDRVKLRKGYVSFFVDECHSPTFAKHYNIGGLCHGIIKLRSYFGRGLP